jgi:3,4-dihydroxy 2-butanone 4-phosphate synthase/GTP cyclohydrolase II
VQPGHIFPLQAQDGRRAGAPATPRPAAISPASAGLQPAAVICEILNDDGTHGAAARPASSSRASTGLKIGTIADLIALPQPATRRLVSRAVAPRGARRRTDPFSLHRLFAERAAPRPHLALVARRTGCADREVPRARARAAVAALDLPP